VKLWDPDAREYRRRLTNAPGGTCLGGTCLLAFSPDGKRLVGAGNGKGGCWVSTWEVPGGRLETAVPTPHVIAGLALSPDGRTLALGHYAGLVTVWDGVGGKLKPRLAIQANLQRPPPRGRPQCHL
jgi:WD40 repeat protein